LHALWSYLDRLPATLCFNFDATTGRRIREASRNFHIRLGRASPEEIRLSLGDFHRPRALRIVVRHRIDPLMRHERALSQPLASGDDFEKRILRKKPAFGTAVTGFFASARTSIA
jgi:hypothetical protein